MATYNVKDLLDKSLYAKKDVSLYKRTGDDKANKPFRTVKDGQIIGVVYSWINPSERSPHIWLMFYDQNKEAYYMKIDSGRKDIDEKTLKEQGVKTDKEKVKEDEAKADRENKGSFIYLIEKYAPFIIGGLILIPIATKLIDKKL